jgi:hypothetical protein
MAKNKKRETSLAKQIADFKKDNPKVAEAMELFGITMTQYQQAIYALNGARVYTSSSTMRLDKTDL